MSDPHSSPPESPHSPGRSNGEWLAGLRAGDDRTVADLRAFLRRGLRRALSNRPGATDADLDDRTQDAMLHLLSRLDSFRGDSRFTTWAMSVALRVSFSELRRRHWGDVSIEALELPPRPDPGATPDASAQSGELADQLRRAIDEHLTGRQRTAILAELSGMPPNVLADQLGTNLNALYKLYHDARKKLRKVLEESGVQPDDLASLTDGES